MLDLDENSEAIAITKAKGDVATSQNMLTAMSISDKTVATH